MNIRKLTCNVLFAALIGVCAADSNIASAQSTGELAATATVTSSATLTLSNLSGNVSTLTFAGTGAEAAYQPLSQYGYFTKTTTAKPMLSAAAGVTFRLSPKLSLRGEIRDFASGFPAKVLTPPSGVKYGSLLNEIVPMVSIVYSK